MSSFPDRTFWSNSSMSMAFRRTSGFLATTWGKKVKHIWARRGSGLWTPPPTHPPTHPQPPDPIVVTYELYSKFEGSVPSYEVKSSCSLKVVLFSPVMPPFLSFQEHSRGTSLATTGSSTQTGTPRPGSRTRTGTRTAQRWGCGGKLESLFCWISNTFRSFFPTASSGAGTTGRVPTTRPFCAWGISSKLERLDWRRVLTCCKKTFLAKIFFWLAMQLQSVNPARFFSIFYSMVSSYTKFLMA